MADRYVDIATGNDSTGTGSAGSPFATIGRAAGAGWAGNDRLLLKGPGTYTVSGTTTNISGGPVQMTAGTSVSSVARVVGYSVTPGDGAPAGRPVIAWAGNPASVTPMFNLGEGAWCSFESIVFDCGAFANAAVIRAFNSLPIRVRAAKVRNLARSFNTFSSYSGLTSTIASFMISLRPRVRGGGFVGASSITAPPPALRCLA